MINQTRTQPNIPPLQMNLPLPAQYRLTSVVRLPSSSGRGVYNEATLYHDVATLRVSWHSCQVDSRLKRGCYVEIRGGVLTLVEN